MRTTGINRFHSQIKFTQQEEVLSKNKMVAIASISNLKQIQFGSNFLYWKRGKINFDYVLRKIFNFYREQKKKKKKLLQLILKLSI